MVKEFTCRAIQQLAGNDKKEVNYKINPQLDKN